MLGRMKEYLRSHTKYGRSRYLNFLYRYDMQRFFKHSAMEQEDASAIAGRIRLLVHSLEKGLSVENPKTDFGREKVLTLLRLIEVYRSCNFDVDPQAVLLAESVLGSYTQSRILRGEDVSFVPEAYQIPNNLAGVKIHMPYDSEAFSSIAYNRHSVRTFSDVPVSKESLRAAVSLAQTAPSACNRQGIHVFACTNPEKIGEIVSKHGGLRGFSNLGVILVIAGDLRLYHSEYERNTVYVDGGIYVMNLLYSLEVNKIAACPIIWGAEPDKDLFIRQLLGIPESYEVVALIAAGNYPHDPVKVPVSSRRDTKDIFHVIE